ncbi:GHMP kinase [bacterium]|nr:MAG: GHMP kinase [bacterium]
MIISRTPYRLSFVGGGTDLRSFYCEETGQVLSTAIDKYLFVVVKRQIGIVEFKYRVNWSKVEFKNDINDIEHPIVREALNIMDIDFPIEITTFADIPANTGLGSSSAFAVGLLHALYALKGEMVTKYTLASEAARIEVDVLKRIMGKQDHFASAYGNFNVFTFNPDETTTVEPIFYRAEVKEKLQKNLLMFYTAKKRDASDILTSQNRETANKREVLRKMRDLVAPMREVISRGNNLDEFGEILHEGWKLKKSLTKDISSSAIDAYYEEARAAGAIGGKLLGAGGGGFLLFYVNPEKQDAVIKALPDLYLMQPGFDSGGSRITYYDQTKF